MRKLNMKPLLLCHDKVLNVQKHTNISIFMEKDIKLNIIPINYEKVQESLILTNFQLKFTMKKKKFTHFLDS